MVYSEPFCNSLLLFYGFSRPDQDIRADFRLTSGYIVTLSAVFWGVAIFSENHSLIVWLSLLVMLLGLLLVTPRKEVDKVLPPPLPSGTRPFRPKSD